MNIQIHTVSTAALLKVLAPRSPAKAFSDGSTQVRAELAAALEVMRPTAQRMVGAGADDLLQTTALYALRSAHLFQAGTNLKAWLWKIFRNARFDTYRRARPTLEYSEVPEAELGRIGAQQAAADMLDAERAYGRLAPEHQQVLRYIGVGESYEDTAGEIGVSVGTVKSRLWRARKAMKEAVA